MVPKTTSCCCGLFDLEVGCRWIAYTRIVLAVLSVVGGLAGGSNIGYVIGYAVFEIVATLIFLFVGLGKKVVFVIFAYLVLSVVWAGLALIYAIVHIVSFNIISIIISAVIAGLQIYFAIVIYSYWKTVKDPAIQDTNA